VNLRVTTGRIAAALVAFSIEAATVAPAILADSSGGHCATMVCCALRGGACPMKAPSSRPSFRTCRSDPQAPLRAAKVTLSLPGRVDAKFESQFSEMLADVSAPRKLWRPTEPGVPPPERLA
jgi:hypothetical protein